MTQTYFFQFFRLGRLEDIRILQNAAFFCTMPRGLGLIQFFLPRLYRMSYGFATRAVSGVAVPTEYQANTVVKRSN